MEQHEATVSRIADYRRRLQEERVAYQGALVQTQATPIHPTILEDLREVQALCQRYQAGGDSVLAVYLLAQVTQLLDQLLAPWAVVAAFEGIQKRLKSLEEG